MLSQAAHHLKSLLDSSLVIYKADEIIVIIGYQNRGTARPGWLKHTSERLRAENLIVSIGPIVGSAAEIETSYRLAKQTAEVARCLGASGVTFYGDYIQYSLLMRAINTPEHHLLIRQIISPLQEEDNRYNNELVRTLTYAVLAEDLPSASQRLGVHVNTVRYRLGKIHTLTGYDFFHPPGRYALTSAILLHQFDSG